MDASKLSLRIKNNVLYVYRGYTEREAVISLQQMGLDVKAIKKDLPNTGTIYMDKYGYLHVKDLKQGFYDNAVDTGSMAYNPTNEEKFFAYGTLTLSDSNLIHYTSYAIYWGNKKGILPDYEPVCILHNDGQDAYNFTSHNAIPHDARYILIANHEGTEIYGGIAIPESKVGDRPYGDKVYSVGVITDIAIDSTNTGSIDKFNDTMRYFNKNTDMVCCAGGNVKENTEVNWSTLKEILELYPVPFYTVCDSTDSAVTDELYTSTIGRDKDFSMVIGEVAFIFLSMDNNNVTTSGGLTAEKITWLEGIFEVNQDKKIVIFYNLFLPGTCGTINGDISYGKDLPFSEVDTVGTSFINLVGSRTNVALFSGYSGYMFKEQEKDTDVNIHEDINVNHHVHIPSLSNPESHYIAGTYPDMSEAYIVDVYEYAIFLKGINMITKKYIPLAQYIVVGYLNEGVEE